MTPIALFFMKINFCFVIRFANTMITFICTSLINFLDFTKFHAPIQGVSGQHVRVGPIRCVCRYRQFPSNYGKCNSYKTMIQQLRYQISKCSLFYNEVHFPQLDGNCQYSAQTSYRSISHISSSWIGACNIVNIIELIGHIQSRLRIVDVGFMGALRIPRQIADLMLHVGTLG